MTTSISVALCTHNGARFVSRQLESILDQSVPVGEVVLSDDDSRDDTVELAMAVVGDRVPITVLVNRPALGVTANFEAAVRATSGEIVVLSDQDDVWHRDRVERAVDRLSDPAVDLVFSDARLVGPDGAPIGGTLLERLRPTVRERTALEAGDLYSALVRRNLVTGATVAFRRRLLDAALPFPAEWVHDEWLAIVAAATAGVAFEDEALIDYRLHESNVIGVRAPTLAVKVRRVLEADGGRTAGLAARAERLAERLSAADFSPLLGPERRADTVALARGKAEAEARRASLPRARARRLPAVLRLLVDGSYERYTSQGRLEALRDLIQAR